MSLSAPSRPKDYPPTRTIITTSDNSIVSVQKFFDDLKQSVLGIIHLRGGSKEKENISDIESIEHMKELLLEKENPNINIYYNKMKLKKMKNILKKIEKKKTIVNKKIFKGGFLESFYKII